jgi:hypothetical protein
MAGDWLKIEAATPDKPEVFEIAVQLNMQPAEAFGRLFLVWRWFDQHTESGNAHNVTSAYLNHIAGVTGFAEAMHNVGWLDMKPDGSFGCSLPNFDRHNGKTAKTRVLTAKRVATHKLRNGNGALTQEALPREEKRREDKDTSRKGLQPVPKDWKPNERTVENLSREFGLVPEDVDRYVAAFHDACASKGYRYKDFDAAFRNSVRQDWPKFRQNKTVGKRDTLAL